jgi:hypothetical protein
MSPRSDKWIRSLKENPAGKVVADDEGNRWQWESDDETARQLKQLSNDELAIEKTDVRPVSTGRDRERRDAVPPLPRDAAGRPVKPGARDAGGGFNPYDHSGKPRRRR